MLSHEAIKKLKQDIVIKDTLCDLPMQFHTTWGLFSPREIDEGTHLLMKYLHPEEADHCLDLGCGYGPIGLTLAKLAPKGKSVLLDKDFIAVDYSRKNAELNQLNNVDVRLSNGLSALADDERFDLVVSNIPAKVGKELLQIMLHDIYQHLNPGGRLYVVTINGLRDFMKRHFKDVFGNYKKVKQGKNYTVSMAEKEN